MAGVRADAVLWLLQSVLLDGNALFLLYAWVVEFILSSQSHNCSGRACCERFFPAADCGQNKKQWRVDICNCFIDRLGEVTSLQVTKVNGSVNKS